MSEVVKAVAEFCAAGLELAGIAVIVVGAVLALAAYMPAFRSARERSVAD